MTRREFTMLGKTYVEFTFEDGRKVTTPKLSGFSKQEKGFDPSKCYIAPAKQPKKEDNV